MRRLAPKGEEVRKRHTVLHEQNDTDGAVSSSEVEEQAKHVSDPKHLLGACRAEERHEALLGH